MRIFVVRAAIKNTIHSSGPISLGWREDIMSVSFGMASIVFGAFTVKVTRQILWLKPKVVDRICGFGRIFSKGSDKRAPLGLSDWFGSIN